MKLYTIGFTQKTAERFFGLLKDNGVTLLVDTRLKPDTQLSGFAKRADLPYFSRALAGADYVHRPDLAPSAEILDAYRNGGGDWAAYEVAYAALMDARGVPIPTDREVFFGNTCCLLCSERTADHCHRRLLAERLQRVWPDLEIVHLS
jgi:uncharacterized protein (DUF488 family)